MRKKGGLRGSMIAAIVLSSFTALVLCFGIAVFLLKRGAFRQPEQTPHDVICTPAKLSGTTVIQFFSPFVDYVTHSSTFVKLWIIMISTIKW